jgi:hypothetical protein
VALGIWSWMAFEYTCGWVAFLMTQNGSRTNTRADATELLQPAKWDKCLINWLVVWNIFYFSIYWE